MSTQHHRHDDDDDDGRPHGLRRLAWWFLELCEDALERSGGRPHGGPGGGPDGQGRPGAPLKPLAAGATAPPVSVPAADMEALTRAALGAAAATAAGDGTPAGGKPPAQVVWQDADGEVLVHLDRTRVVLHPGLVLVAMTLETDQTGAGELVVPFAVGGPDSPAGLIAVTERLPRGPQALVDRWGQSVIAAAWLALLDVAHGLALHTGVDEEGARLIPGALSVDGSQLTVVPQARHSADRVAGR